MLNVDSIFKDRSITSFINFYFQTSEPPVYMYYKYNKPIINTTFIIVSHVIYLFPVMIH